MVSLRLVAFSAIFLLLLVDLDAVLVSNAEWAAYKRLYNKAYAPEHDYHHRWIYSPIVAGVRKNNLEYAQGKVAYLLKVNEFSDTERSALFANSPPVPAESILPGSKPANYKYYHEIQDGIDWRQSGYVSSVKHQGNCNSCWAFSTSGLLEAHLAKKTGKQVSMSPKHLLDCVNTNSGCYGGWVSYALNYTRDNGISAWESYSPYKPQNEPCDYKPKSNQISPRGYVILKPDEKEMAEVVYNIGPVTISLDHLYSEFYEYSRGVLSIPKCRNKRIFLKHSMLVVGFGTDPEGGDYWLIKNSFGKNWGEDGYVRLARNADNMCGVASLAQYPVF
ncbi:hypothetical protein KR059_003794 [Drosophila kikkawai]|nr:hypothetical protein KR059_003794 [Drosophila kikkawai]